MLYAVVHHWVITRWLYLASYHTGDIIVVCQEEEEAVGSIKERENTFYSERDAILLLSDYCFFFSYI